LKNAPSDETEPKDIEFYLLAVDYPLNRIVSDGSERTLPLVFDFSFQITKSDDIEIVPTVKTYQGKELGGADENGVDYSIEDKIFEFNSGRASNEGITHVIVSSNQETSCLSSIRAKILWQVTETENIWGVKKSGKTKKNLKIKNIMANLYNLVLKDSDLRGCQKYYKFKLSDYKIDSTANVYEFQIDILENAEAYAKSDFSPLSDLLMYLPFEGDSKRYAYNIFYKSIFRQETLEEYSATSVLNENNQIKLTNFSENNEMHKYLHSYLCQRVVDYENKVMGSQCYFKDDPLNRVVNDIYIKNYERNLLSIEDTSLSQDTRDIVKALYNLAKSEDIPTYRVLKGNLYNIFRRILKISFFPGQGILFAITSIVSDPRKKDIIKHALNGEPFEVLLPVKFEVIFNILNNFILGI
jgi:hypothetical protein